MPPNASDIILQSTLNIKHSTNRNSALQTGDNWLKDKKKYDGAEGLWRIHNNIYDVTQYIDKHPGGRMWLELTKGTDITEAFECHHISTKPGNILKEYFVRPAKTARNSPFTFEDDGLFRTLKRKLIPMLEKVPKDSSRFSDITTDLLFVGTFVFAVLAASVWSYILGFIASMCLCFTTIASHNYFHRRDNLRMYYFDLSLMNFREWRITHALSHHLYPNTIIDFEITFLKPLILYLPQKKPWMIKYGSWFFAFIFWTNLFTISFLKRIIQVVYLNERQHLHWSNAISFVLPMVMYLLSGQSFLWTIGMWFYIITCGSLLFSCIAFNAAHHHPEIFHDGDTPRSQNKYDWGQYQLDTVAERYNVNRSPFFVLTAFGDHCLHHIFPTIDHGALKYLHNEFEKIVKEFKADWRLKTEIEMVKGQFMQLLKEKPNPKPPGSR